MKLSTSSNFDRHFKKLVKKRPAIESKVRQVLKKLQDNPFDRSLKSHPLKAEFRGVYSCSIGYDLRILFMITANPEKPSEHQILIIDIGTHDEVY